MKRTIAILILLSLSRCYGVATNTTTASLTTTGVTDYADFEWNWTAINDQALDITFDKDVSSDVVGFRLARKKTGDTQLEIAGFATVTSNATIAFSGTNLPPTGRYYAEFMHYSTNNPAAYNTLSKGKVNILNSLWISTNTQSEGVTVVALGYGSTAWGGDMLGSTGATLIINTNVFTLPPAIIEARGASLGEVLGFDGTSWGPVTTSLGDTHYTNTVTAGTYVTVTGPLGVSTVAVDYVSLTNQLTADGAFDSASGDTVIAGDYVLVTGPTGATTVSVDYVTLTNALFSLYATAAQGISATNAETIVLANSNEWATAYINSTNWIASVAYNITTTMTSEWSQAYIAGTNWLASIASDITTTMTNEWSKAYINSTNWLASVAYTITVGDTNKWTEGAATADTALPAADATLQTILSRGDTATNQISITGDNQGFKTISSACDIYNLLLPDALHFCTDLGNYAEIKRYGSSTRSFAVISKPNGFADIETNLLWDAGNDGTGSGLDADKLDGLDSTGFATAAQGISATNAETIVLGGRDDWNTAYTYATNWWASVARGITSTMTNQFAQAYINSTNWLASVAYTITTSDTDTWNSALQPADTNGWVVTDTTYTGGTNIDINGTEISLDAAGQASDDLADSAVQTESQTLQDVCTLSTSGTNTSIFALPGQSLATLYQTASALTPNGSAISSANRASLIVYAGTYPLAADLVLSNEYVDVVSATGLRDVFLTGNTIDLENNVTIRGLDVGVGQYIKMSSDTGGILIDNCRSGLDYTDYWQELTFSGTIKNSTFGDGLCFSGTFSGTAINNTFGRYVGQAGTFSGTAIYNIFGVDFCTGGGTMSGKNYYCQFADASPTAATGAGAYIGCVNGSGNVIGLVIGTDVQAYSANLLASTNAPTAGQMVYATGTSKTNLYFADAPAGGSLTNLNGANIQTGTVDETALDVSVNASLDKADAALPRSGGTMSGDVVVDGNQFIEVGDITLNEGSSLTTINKLGTGNNAEAIEISMLSGFGPGFICGASIGLYLEDHATYPGLIRLGSGKGTIIQQGGTNILEVTSAGVSVQTNKILNVATGTADTDGVNKGQMDTAIAAGGGSGTLAATNSPTAGQIAYATGTNKTNLYFADAPGLWTDDGDGTISYTSTSTNSRALNIILPPVMQSDTTIFNINRDGSKFRVDEDGDTFAKGFFKSSGNIYSHMDSPEAVILSKGNITLSADLPYLWFNDKTAGHAGFYLKANSDVFYIDDEEQGDVAKWTGGVYGLLGMDSNSVSVISGYAGIVAFTNSGTTQLFAWNDAGTFTQLSAHDPATGMGYDHSFNVYTGERKIFQREEWYDAIDNSDGWVSRTQYKTISTGPIIHPEKNTASERWDAYQQDDIDKRDAEIATWVSNTNAVEVKGIKPDVLKVALKPQWLEDWDNEQTAISKDVEAAQ